MAQQHLIRRQILKVQAHTSNGLALQSRITKLIQEELPPRLEEVFNSLMSSNEWLVLDQLHIQMEAIREDELEHYFIERLIRSIRGQLELKSAQIITRAIPGEKPALRVSSTERTLQAFIFFLENGQLPWWYEVSSHAAFEEDLLFAMKQQEHAPSGSLAELLQKIVSIQAAAGRLAEQFGEEIFISVLKCMLLARYAGTQANILAAYQKLFAGINKGNLLHVKEKHSKLIEIKSSLLQKLLESSDVLEWLTKDTLNSPTSDVAQINQQENIQKKDTTSELSEGVIIYNAGLVIVAPFLPAFFESCGILAQHTITDVDKAIALLHYIAVGQSEYREYHTVLNKVLCGVDISAQIGLVTEISEEEQEQAEALLKSVISHWDVLKNTSPDGLREGFLQRKATLAKKNGTWLLQVEQHPIDVLLQHLPWTIGYIKLPWMPAVLQTEWN